MKNILPEKLRQLAINKYGIKSVYQVVPNDEWCKMHGIDAHLEKSAIAGDEIWIGIYKSKELLLASFFHELGHRASAINCKKLNSNNLFHCSKLQDEKCAWKEQGYVFSAKVTTWVKKNLSTYLKYK